MNCSSCAPMTLALLPCMTRDARTEVVFRFKVEEENEYRESGNSTISHEENAVSKLIQYVHAFVRSQLDFIFVVQKSTIRIKCINVECIKTGFSLRAIIKRNYVIKWFYYGLHYWTLIPGAYFIIVRRI